MFEFETLLKKRKCHFPGECGQSLVEFALLLPVLLMVFMGIFDFGWILHKQIQIDQSTRAAARRGAVGVNNTTLRQIIDNTCSFPLTPEQITIQVLDSNGNVVSNSEDRTPDNFIKVSIIMNDVQLVTPLNNLVQNITSVNLRSESTFIIE